MVTREVIVVMGRNPWLGDRDSPTSPNISNSLCS